METDTETKTIAIQGLDEGEFAFQGIGGANGTVTGLPEPPVTPRSREEAMADLARLEPQEAPQGAEMVEPEEEEEEEAEAADRAPPPADPLFLPDGTPLLLTLSRKIWLGRIFGREKDDAWPGPNRPMEDQAVLYLAGNPAAVWQAPGREDGGPVRPLVHRPRAFQQAMDEWTDEKLPDFNLRELRELAGALWDGEHATQIVVLSKKKEMREQMTRGESLRTGANNS